MPKQTKIFYSDDFINEVVNFVNADGINNKVIFTAPVDGAIITAISASSTASVTNQVVFSLQVGSSTTEIGQVSVTAGAGTNGTTPVVNVLNATSFPWLKKDADGNPMITLRAGNIILARVRTAVASTAGHRIGLAIHAEEM